MNKAVRWTIRDLVGRNMSVQNVLAENINGRERWKRSYVECAYGPFLDILRDYDIYIGFLKRYIIKEKVNGDK